MARTSLARSATGLARFYLDCGFWRTRSFRSLPLDALGLWVCLVGACNEQATDGRLPADPEDLAAAVGLRLSRVKKPLATLIKAGRITVDGDELEIVGFSDHNPTSKEVAEYTEERSRQGGRGNHVRWHENQHRWTADCPMCIEDHPTCPPDWDDITSPAPDPPPDRPPDPEGDRSSDRSGDPERIGNPIANSSHGMGWDGMGTHSQGSNTTTGVPDVGTSPGGGSIKTRVSRVVSVLADRALAEAHQPPDKPDAYRASIVRRLQADGTVQRIEAYARSSTPMSAEQIADLVTPPTDPPPSDPAPIHPAVHAAHQPPCPTCDGMHVVEQGDGTWHSCPDCTSVLT